MLGAREEGFEPPTYGFEGHCSTTELLPLGLASIQSYVLATFN